MELQTQAQPTGGLMANVIHSEKTYWTPQRRLMSGTARGRRPGRLPGGHIADLVDLKKAITLCGNCQPKFNAVKSGYVTKLNLPVVQGRCDGCSQFTPNGRLLVHHTIASLA